MNIGEIVLEIEAIVDTDEDRAPEKEEVPSHPHLRLEKESQPEHVRFEKDPQTERVPVRT